MTILIILVALIAIAMIFGRGAAQTLVLGSGALGLVVVVIVVAVILFGGLWEWVQTDRTAQHILGWWLFVLLAGLLASVWSFLTKEREHGQNNEVNAKDDQPKQKELTSTQIAIAVIVVIVFLVLFQQLP